MNIEMESARLHLVEDGFVVMHELIDPAALKKLGDRVALFYRAWERLPESTRKEFYPRALGEDYLPVREINWPEAALRLLRDDPAVLAVHQAVDSLSAGRCRLIHANSLLKPADNGSPVLPHQDTAYNVQSLHQPLTAWIPFEGVTEESGALYYLAGSHRLGDLEHVSAGGVRWLTESRLSRFDQLVRHKFCGRPGSVGIHDSRLIHGSFSNRSSRDRLALSLRFAAVTGTGGTETHPQSG